LKFLETAQHAPKAELYRLAITMLESDLGLVKIESDPNAKEVA